VQHVLRHDDSAFPSGSMADLGRARGTAIALAKGCP
jgi:hypothetical protein